MKQIGKLNYFQNKNFNSKECPQSVIIVADIYWLNGHSNGVHVSYENEFFSSS